jgi:hypothetical protein
MVRGPCGVVARGVGPHVSHNHGPRSLTPNIAFTSASFRFRVQSGRSVFGRFFLQELTGLGLDRNLTLDQMAWSLAGQACLVRVRPASLPLPKYPSDGPGLEGGLSSGSGGHRPVAGQLGS